MDERIKRAMMAKERRSATIGFPFKTKQDNPGAAADQIVPALECLVANQTPGPLPLAGAALEFLIQVSRARDHLTGTSGT